MGPDVPSRTPLLVIMGVAAAGVALVGGFLAGRATAPSDAPSGLAPQSVTVMLADRVAAVNSGDADSIAKYYTPDAVLEELDQSPPVVTRTARLIATHLVAYQQLGFRLEQTGGAITALGPFVTEPLTWSGGAGGLVTYQLAGDGRISHQWVIGADIPASD